MQNEEKGGKKRNRNKRRRGIKAGSGKRLRERAEKK